jgi:D-alanine-D-alanine ligase-like ATP-grasp enzyme
MRICVLTDETIEEFDPSAYLQDYEWEMETVQEPVFDCIRNISLGSHYDAYLNLFEGFTEDDNSGFDAIQALENLNLPFTGAGTKFYNPTREHMQEIAERNNIRFARGFHAEFENELLQASDLRFPLIVKHPNSYASAGLTRASRVDSFEQLHEQFKRISAAYGSARVEEFIEGREVSCLVVDNPDDLSAPFAYPPAEVSFPPGETFLHEEVKWFNWDTYIVPFEDPAILTKIQDISTRLYAAMNGEGYARVDFRLRPSGELIILEINANCGIFYGPEDRGHADLPITWDAGGHKGFLDRIFRAAVLRHRMRSQSINYNP